MAATARAELIFVTGASGFLGSHVILQLLERGYRVRAVARGAKADALKSSYASYADRFEAVKIADLINDQFPEALVDVDAVMHLASPLAGRAEPAELLKTAEEGTLNVIRQAEKAGVHRMVVTSSIATVFNPNNSFTDKDWNPVTREFAVTGGDPMATYAASKKFAEQALWAWADQHPHVDITTLNPTFFYGPFAPHFHIPKPDFFALSTNILLYNLLFPEGTFPSDTRYVDVRDVARAHVLALTSPPTSKVGRKRIVFSSPTGWPFEKTVQFIREKRPALKERLIAKEPQAKQFDVLPLDWTRVEEVLGMRKDEDFHTTEETILDTVDALIKVEEGWKAAGCAIEIPPPL